MKRIHPLLFALFFAAACEPANLSFPAGETPLPLIVPVTETPLPLIVPVTETLAPFQSPTEEEPFIVPVVETSEALPGPRWWDVYFTEPLRVNNPNDPAGSVEEKLIGFINAAQTSVHIASFEFNLPRVADALIAAKARGVDVRWATDDKNGLLPEGQPNPEFVRLFMNGIEIKDDAGRGSLMHNKFWIFDRAVVWTGSTNVTVNGVYKQNNNVIVIYSPQIASIYEREWEELWAGQLGPRAPSTVGSQWAILEGTPIQVLFSAEDNALASLIALVRDAKFSVRFLAFSFTHDDLARAMIERAQAGVDVQGVYETFGSASIYSDFKTFWCAGVPVRLDGNPSLMHHKVIVVDNSIVVTGSLNFTEGADKENEENVLILENPEIAALYLQEFQRVWSLANDPQPETADCR